MPDPKGKIADPGFQNSSSCWKEINLYETKKLEQFFLNQGAGLRSNRNARP